LVFVTVVCLPLHLVEIAGPQGQVVSQELHNRRTVTVLILLKAIQVRDCIVECLLGNLACDFWAIEDFVVEDGVVECQTQSNWVSALEILSLVLGSEVAVLSLLLHSLAPVEIVSILAWKDHLPLAWSEFAKVPVVVALHLHVEDLRLGLFVSLSDKLVKLLKDLPADVIHLSLNLLPVGPNQLEVLAALVLFFVLNRRDCSPGCATRTDLVLVGYR
jgi:hypothetical protein